MAAKFYYFGFGSNMLAKRIHIQNPTAVRVGTGKLDNYRLDFHTCAKTWRGAPATIVPTVGANVFGAIWQIDCTNIKDLDDQEGVHIGMYMPITVPVLSVDSGETIMCRTYHLKTQPCEDLRCMPASCVPCDRQPSKSYLKTLVKGAVETGVPADYIAWLRSLRHNGEEVDSFEKQLELETIIL